MDRREALKRIAVGGAVAASGPLILSSPAFAYQAPTVTGALPSSITSTSAHEASITYGALPSGTCPGSATGGTTAAPTVISRTHQLNSGSIVTGTIVSKGSGNNWNTNDRVTLRTIGRYTCVYSGSTVTVCYQWVEVFRPGGNNNSGPFVQVSETGPDVVACP